LRRAHVKPTETWVKTVVERLEAAEKESLAKWVDSWAGLPKAAESKILVEHNQLWLYNNIRSLACTNSWAFTVRSRAMEKWNDKLTPERISVRLAKAAQGFCAWLPLRPGTDYSTEPANVPAGKPQCQEAKPLSTVVRLTGEKRRIRCQTCCGPTKLSVSTQSFSTLKETQGDEKRESEGEKKETESEVAVRAPRKSSQGME
jgi:hypothetical protein